MHNGGALQCTQMGDLSSVALVVGICGILYRNSSLVKVLFVKMALDTIAFFDEFCATSNVPIGSLVAKIMGA